jgi:hypothetical protein
MDRCRGDTVGCVVAVPSSLHAVVQARWFGWRVHVAPSGVRGVLAAVVCVLNVVVALVLGVVGFAAFGLIILVGFTGLLIVAFGGGASFDRLTGVGLLVASPLLFFVSLFAIAGAATLAGIAGPFAVGFHRIDLRPATAPTRVVVTGWGRRSVIKIADLTRVIVRHCPAESARPGEPELELVLRAGKRTIVCPVLDVVPLLGLPRRSDPQVLADWLGDVLRPREVPVHLQHGTFSLPTGHAWPASMAAAVWGVPETDVPVLADRLRVHTAGEPDTLMFNAYDVEACAPQARRIAVDDDPEPPSR